MKAIHSPSGEKAIAFVYAGDVWAAGRDGGGARRLTVHPGVETSPAFSPFWRPIEESMNRI